MFAVTILGNNSALSMHDRHQTAQVVSCEGNQFLIDCGESTQSQMQRYKIKRSRIDHIFISHLHGDHFFGLPGLLNTFNLSNRKEDLHLYGPPQLMEVLTLINQVSCAHFGYRIQFHELRSAGKLLESDNLSISCFPVSHRIPCWGFRFDLSAKPEKIRDGKVVKPAQPGLSYAYCADTCYDEKIIEHIKNVDLLYHESTYLDDQGEKALMRFHSTCTQAATIAIKAGAGRLLLGHYSSKYDDIHPFEAQAREAFQNSTASREGVTYLVHEH
jgi:ribonuclease Z